MPMPFAAIPETLNDLFVVFGFGSGLASMIGLIVALYQIWLARKQVAQAQSAAEAARRAAERVLNESRKSLQRYLAAQVHALLKEVRHYVDNEEWMMAALRANDLGDQLALLIQTDESLAAMVDRIREFGRKFHSLEKKAGPKVALGKWNELVQDLQRRIDRLHVPFLDDVEVANAP